jgi:hypothetical protein
MTVWNVGAIALGLGLLYVALYSTIDRGDG